MIFDRMKFFEKRVKNLIKYSDQILCRYYLKSRSERKAFVSFCFHGLLRHEREASLHVVHPHTHPCLTGEHLSQFVEYFIRNNYSFISPQDIISGLQPGNNYIMMTFDDGYYNNMLALPVLRAYGVPAVFFISTSCIKQNKSFWWDVLYRERKKRGTAEDEIFRETASLKSGTNDQIEKYLVNLFGGEAFVPVGDVDRPFTVEELKTFAGERYVHLGNHTRDHAILTNYTPYGIRDQILGAQNDIYEIAGVRPQIIAYPNGNYSPQIIKISREAGLKLGMTISPGKNLLPFAEEGENFMSFRRFCLSASVAISWQLDNARSDVSLYRMAKKCEYWSRGNRMITF